MIILVAPSNLMLTFILESDVVKLQVYTWLNLTMILVALMQKMAL